MYFDHKNNNNEILLVSYKKKKNEEELIYDPFQSPPNFELAKMHGLAHEVGI